MPSATLLKARASPQCVLYEMSVGKERSSSGGDIEMPVRVTNGRGRYYGSSLAVLAEVLGMTGQAQAQTSPPAPAATPVSTTPAAATQQLEEIVVSGSRIARTGFTAPTPVTVVGGVEVQRLAATNVAEALDQVPSFRAQGSPATTGVFGNNVGAQTADLRGLGAQRTLVLVDGRRFVPGTVQGGSFTPGGQVDLNMIPTSLLDRVEVVTGGASAAYGSDAVAGVVNLILNKKLEGLRFQAQYGQAEAGDSQEYQTSLAGGTDLFGGSGHLIGAAEYIDNKGERDCYSRSWCANGYSPISNGTPGVNGLPATVYMPRGRPATISANGLINAGPLRGTTFDANGNPVAFSYGQYYNAGLFMSGGGDPRNGFWEFYPLYAPNQRYNLYTHLDFDLAGSTKAFAEASYGNVSTNIPQAQIRDAAINVQKDNAYLPATLVQQMTAANVTSFTLGRLGDDFGPARLSSQRGTERFAVGMNGDIPNGWWGSGWMWNSYYQFGRTDYDQNAANDRINANFTRAVDAVVAPNGSIVCRSTLSTNPAVAAAAAGCSPLDLFGAGRFSPAAVAYVFGTASQQTKLTQQAAAANFQGNLFNTIAGPASLAGGVEYRRDAAQGSADPISQSLGFYVNNGTPIHGAIEVVEGFLETDVPLLEDQPWAKALNFNGAIRETRYSTSGDVTTWKIGGVYEPTDWLRLRVTDSRDIRAANVFELYNPTSQSLASVRDPVRNQNVLASVIASGNPDLKPEIASTFTAGVVLRPTLEWLAGARLSIDYYDIDLRDAITTTGAQIILNQCAAGATSYCGAITRNANGAITAVRNPYLNVNRLKTRGLDFEASYRLPLAKIAASWPGAVNLRVLATHVGALTTTDATGASVNRAGMDGSPNGQTSGLPDWSVNAGVTYEVGPLSVTTQVRYVNGGIYDATLVGPGQAGYDPHLGNSVSNNFVPSRTYVNLQAQYTLAARAHGDVQIYGAINNLFDVAPPNQIPSAFGPTNPVLYDVIGRAYRVGVRFSY